MTQTITFETRFGTLTIDTSKDIDRDQIKEVREQLELCCDGKSSVCRLDDGEYGTGIYVDDEYKNVTFIFNTKAIYPTRWVDNLFKIIHQLITTRN